MFVWLWKTYRTVWTYRALTVRVIVSKRYSDWMKNYLALSDFLNKMSSMPCRYRAVCSGFSQSYAIFSINCKANSIIALQQNLDDNLRWRWECRGFPHFNSLFQWYYVVWWLLYFNSKWSLVCDRAYLGATIQSCFFAGMLIGSFVTGMISDAWGRKKCIFLCNSIMVGSSY
jgi:hypothetical protein